VRAEFPAFENTAIGRRVVQIARGLRVAAATARSAYRLTTRPQPSPVRLQASAEEIVGAIVRAGAAMRSAAIPPREHNLGAWSAFNGLHAVNAATQAALRTPEARGARTTSGAGIEPLAYAPFPEITLPVIAEAEARCDRLGWCDRKIDIDRRLLRGDSHLRSVDRIRRAPVFTAPFRFIPRSSSPAHVLICAAVQAAWDHCDGFISSMGEAGVAAGQGFALQEAVWRDFGMPTTMLSVPVGGGRFARVQSAVISSLAPVLNRNVAFDPVTDRPYVVMGAGHYVDAQEEGLQKFVLFKGDLGDGVTRDAGYQWSTHVHSYLSGMSLSRWAVVIETWGTSSPILITDDTGNPTDDQIERAVEALEAIGTGEPAILSTRAGKLDFTPVPSGLAPLHAQILGYLAAEKSKAVLSATLQVESSQSGVGSFAMANTHLQQQISTSIIDAQLRAEALHSQPLKWICEANAETWARVLGQYIPGGLTPREVVDGVPFCEWVISDETPQQRLATFAGAKQQLSLDVDEDQVRQELRVRKPNGSPAPAPAPAPGAPTE
jgi:hypothetical protein